MLTNLSARTAPWDNSRLRSIFFGDTSRSFRTLTASISISSVRMKDIGKRNRSFAELDRSRSCQSGTFSNAGMASALSSLAKLDARSLSCGFLFEGRAELPTCFCRSKGSKASAISQLSERASSLAKRSEEHTSELQSLAYLVCRLL